MFVVTLTRPPASPLTLGTAATLAEARARARDARKVARGWVGAVVTLRDAEAKERVRWTNTATGWVAAPAPRAARPRPKTPGPVERIELPRGLRLVLDLPTVSEANTADHAHWRARHRRARTQIAAVTALLATHARAHLTLPRRVTFHRLAPNALDREDNLPVAFKHLRDGVAQALGLPDDRDPRVTWRYAQAPAPTLRLGLDLESREDGPAQDVEILEDLRDLIARIERLVGLDALPTAARAHGRALLAAAREGVERAPETGV